MHTLAARARWRRATAVAAVALAGLPLLGATAPDRVKPIEVALETPVYRLAGGLPVHTGEQFYRLHWSGFPVARVWISMAPDPERDAVDVEIRGATHPVIDWLWRYRFQGRGHVRTDPFGPGGFLVDACENREHERTEIRFDVPGDRADRIEGWRHVDGRLKQYYFHSDNTYDIPSSAYLVLNLDYAPGRRFALDAFTGKSRYLVEIEVQAREPIALGDRTHDAWRLRVLTRELTDDDPEGRHRETLLWVSPERPRRLLRASSATFVGAIHLELETDDPPDADAARDAGVVHGRCT